MARASFITLAVLFASISHVSLYPQTESLTVPFVSRELWGAMASGPVYQLNSPASYVMIHHTYRPNKCLTQSACITAMQNMQSFHQQTNGWPDFGYNFAVGGEGYVYEGRGWNVVGAHTVGYNSSSISIVFIGDFVSSLPPEIQLQNTQKLIADGVRLGFISSNYRLIGHRQVIATQCPGDALFREIQGWENFCWWCTVSGKPFELHTRNEWDAEPATDIEPLTTPVPYVVIHHTYIPEICLTPEECKRSMRAMQRYHQSLDWGDIGYNLCVGGEGRAYEGRGWLVKGVHAAGVNSISVGICLIGDFRNELPPEVQIETTKALIEQGVANGYISPDYKLIGHRQVRNTECPGDALFNLISTWDHFEPNFELPRTT